MQPTRKIVTPIKGLWNSKRKVWFQKNDDSKPVREEYPHEKDERMLTEWESQFKKGEIKLSKKFFREKFLRENQ